MTDCAPNRRQISAAHVAAAILGGVLIGVTRTHRGVLATAARLVGGGLVAGVLGPSLSNGVVRAGAERRRVRLRTTLVVQMPVRDAFAFCRDFENFPRVVLALERVVDYQDGRSHWEVRSPRGELLAWDAVVTKYVPNVIIAWHSVPGSVVDCSGLIRFAPIDAESSRLDVEIQYDPCHTGFRDAIRALVDLSRERQLEADLARAKRYLTTQTAPAAPDLEPEGAAT
jgi:uncharacterized membrane protein